MEEDTVCRTRMVLSTVPPPSNYHRPGCQFPHRIVSMSPNSNLLVVVAWLSGLRYVENIYIEKVVVGGEHMIYDICGEKKERVKRKIVRLIYPGVQNRRCHTL